jgi:hypothetical protein
MVERRRLGLYFNCNEKSTRVHNRFCQCIFFLDGVEIEDAAEATSIAENDGEAPCRPWLGFTWRAPSRSL